MDFKDFLGQEGELPLDKIITDGGFVGIFRTIGCVGDSLASGELEGTNEKGEKTYNDYFEYSWGQYMARIAGLTARNFSRGGMTAKCYCDTFAEEMGYWDPELKCQAYIIALGANDLRQQIDVGTTDDICKEDYNKNKQTFAGYYGKIIQRYKEIQPDAKFFLVTLPRSDVKTERTEREELHAALMYEFAEFFSNTYVIDLRKYAPVYDAEFSRNFRLGGHLNATGYLLTAKMFLSYIDYIIRHNMKDFKQAGFIGTPHKNTVDVD